MKGNKKVMVAMSGGVDSSVAAALLKKRGYKVFGATMKVWSEGEENDTAVEDARRVAEKLKIPFYVVNFKDFFKKCVVDYFIEEYLRGRTPNPCVKCNKYIKFDALMEKAVSLGADYLATGHYAKIYFDASKKRYLLARAKDSRKDQSYFLFSLNQKQLSKTLMPLGDFKKDKIRRIAAELELVTAEKPESQEICFIKDNDYRSFIERQSSQKFVPGPFLDTTGKRVGTHRGIPYYTIGQRKGLGLSLGYPVYVTDIDYKNNAVIVGKKEETYSRGLISENNNFILFEKLEKPLRVQAKIRYNSIPRAATIYPEEGDRVKLEFEEPVSSVTPGQAVVYYQGDLVVGGGIISSKF